MKYMKSLSEIKIAVIGAGNLGQSMALGWAQSGQIPAAHITCTRRQTALLTELRDAGIEFVWHPALLLESGAIWLQ